VNISRRVCTTFHCCGTTSSISVTSSPNLASLPRQHGQAAGARIITRRRGRGTGNGARTWLLAGEAGHGGRILTRPGLSGELVFGSARLQFLKLQLELIEEPTAALGQLPEALALQLGDDQLQMRDHRLDVHDTMARNLRGECMMR
jgi:hypothetical protein